MIPPIKVALIFCTAGIAIAQATEVATTPVGVVTVTVAAGNGVSRNFTSLSLPLDTPSQASGQIYGRISSITASTISNSLAGWTLGELSNQEAPTLIRITSGNAKGRVFLISVSSQNTATTVTLDVSEAANDLTTLGIATGANGDTYALLAADTIASIFGTEEGNGILAASTPNQADHIQIMVSGVYRTYYLNSGSRTWRRVGPNTVSDNVVIKPETGLIFSRLSASPMELSVTGTVPTDSRTVTIANAGNSMLSSGWPVSTTLANMQFQNSEGWITNTNPNLADSIQILTAGTFRTYYHNGTNWRRVGPNTVSDSVELAAGSSFVVRKLGTTPGRFSYTHTPPYSL